MARRGRPISGPALVGQLDGPALAKRRLQVILETLAGQRTIAEACEALQIGKSRFHELRKEVLAGALASLEPQPVGRPASSADPQVAALQARVDELQDQLLVSEWQVTALKALSTGTPPNRVAKKKRRRRSRR